MFNLFNEVFQKVAEQASHFAGMFTKGVKKKLYFPKDFERPIDQGGPGEGKPLGGFGGNCKLNQKQHQQKIKKTPVILVHGNSSHAELCEWGMVKLRNRLITQGGYCHSEIWAISYLGEGELDMSCAHQDNIDDLRLFIHAVMTYLNVKKVDIIAHSLGVTLTRAWMKGLSKDNKKLRWDEPAQYDKVGTFVSLGAGNQGTSGFIKEWDPNGRFITELNGNNQAPYGKNDSKSLKDEKKITYVAIWAKNDLIDMLNPETGKLIGADLNLELKIGTGLKGHKALLHDKKVFEAFLPFLNRTSFQ